MEQQHKITLYVYDLSGGMAKAFSPMFLGRQIDGVWHTSIVVYGQQYYFGGGICVGQPKNTPYGFPVKEEQLGETEITMDVFEQYLQSINKEFTIDTYDLFQKNCNHFSNNCSEFLLDKQIPDYITNLPKDVLETPIGQMFKPMIDQMQANARSGQGQLFPQMVEGSSNPQSMGSGGSSSNNNSSSNFVPPPPPPPPMNAFGGLGLGGSGGPGGPGALNPNPVDTEMLNQLLNNLNMGLGGVNNFNNFGSSAPPPAPPSAPFDWKKVTEIQEEMDFFNAMDGSKGCVIQFYANWCGPCKIIKPTFAKYSEDYEQTCPNLKFYSINADSLRDLCQDLDVQAYPTFLFYFKGDKREPLKGANQSALQQKIEQLIEDIKNDK